MKDLFKALGLSKTARVILAVTAALWITVVIASGAGWNPLNVPWAFSNPGAFGDSFGPLNTFMAAAAALGAIAAYKGQTQETERLREREAEQDLISMSDRERLLRREAEADRRAERNAFEATFFRLLDSFRSIVASADVKSGSGVAAGQDAYAIIAGKVRYNRSMAANDKVAWDGAYTTYMNDLGHYFRFLYHVVLFVDRSNAPDKYLYVRLVRAMLSEPELLLLALNCVHGEGRDKFKALVEKYSLLHNLSPQAQAEWHLSSYFAPSAFERPSDPQQ